MGVASQIVTLAEYLKMEYPDGVKDELIKGEVVISPAAKPNHQIIAKRLMELLNKTVDPAKFEVSFDNSIVVEPTDPASMPRPDVFVMGRARFRAAAAEDRYPEGSPELAVEIVSPSNKKTELYLANGSLEVWIVYMKTRTVTVWKKGGTSIEYREGGMLPLPVGLGKRALQVSDIFSVLH
jgi:Uma2 family endonuclease